MAKIFLRIEGGALVGLAIYFLALMLINRPENLSAALFELLFTALAAVVVLASTKFISLRSAVILLNLIALPISRTLVQGERIWIAIPVALLALATLVALFIDRKTLAQLGESPSE